MTLATSTGQLWFRFYEVCDLKNLFSCFTLLFWRLLVYFFQLKNRSLPRHDNVLSNNTLTVHPYIVLYVVYFVAQPIIIKRRTSEDNYRNFVLRTSAWNLNAALLSSQKNNYVYNMSNIWESTLNGLHTDYRMIILKVVKMHGNKYRPTVAYL